MYDTHVHTAFSKDGISAVEDYIGLLDRKKIEGIGFAEHVDFMPECGSYGFFDYETYMTAIRKYQDDGYQLHAGAEIDYAKSVEEEILRHLKQKAYEYTICSVHMIDGVSISDGKNVERFLGEDSFVDMIEKYYREVKHSVKVKNFDVIGHINIYKRYMAEKYLHGMRILRLVEEMDYELAKICALSGKILEVNTSGIFSPLASILPETSFLKNYYGFGGRLISIGSDAHTAAHVGRGFKEAMLLLRDIGFNYIFLPWDRENPVRIE